MFRSAKNLLIVLIAPLTLFANPAKAGIKATYLSAGGEVHTPISVRCSNDSTYTVTDSGLRIDTLVYPVYADDYNGYALVLPEAIIIDDKDGYTFAYYNFTTRHTTALRQKALGHRVCTEKRRYGSAFDYYREAITRPVVREPYRDYTSQQASRAPTANLSDFADASPPTCTSTAASAWTC